MKIGIVTDSTADLTQELIEKYQIEVIPLQVSIDNQIYRDGLDLTPTQFYQKLEQTNTQPTTSQPAPGLFVECYQQLLKKVDAIISIHLTEHLSGTVHTAQMAREMFPKANIQVIDSQSTTMGLGGIVIEAARAAQKGIRFEQLTGMIQELRGRLNFFVILDTLEFLQRGGRASKLQNFFSSVLQIKPLIKLLQGEVKLVTKVRSRQQSIHILLEEFKTHVPVDTQSIIAIMHTAAEKEAQKLKLIIQETFRNAEVIINQAGPVLGTHVGPGALALINIPRL
jgi:DegV family protein with EDD domain